MKKIKELIVVEGNHDKAKLEKLFDCKVVTTHGLALDKETIEYIRKANETCGVIVLTDPDFPGEKIRNQIIDAGINCQHIFVDKKKAIGKRNVGIEYVSDDDLILAFNDVVNFDSNKESLDWNEYLDLNLDSQIKRDKVSSFFKIGKCNNKTLFKRLNIIGVNKKQILEVIND